MDCGIKGFGIGECLVGEMMSFEITPDAFDIVEFGRVFGQPLDGEPMLAGGKCGQRRLAGVDRAVVEHDDDGLDPHSRLRAVQKIEGLQQGHEVGAALAAGRGDDQLTAQPVKCAHHGDFLRLSGSRHAQIRAALGPRVSACRSQRFRFAKVA
jgi:hypothetical protein